MPHSTPDARYYHNAAGTIVHVPGEDFLRLQWSAHAASPDELRAVYHHAQHALRHFGYHKLLSDHSQRPPLPVAITEWLAAEWIPTAVANFGYSHCAIVENHTPLGRLAAQSIGALLPANTLVVKYFTALPEASAWLRAQ